MSRKNRAPLAGRVIKAAGWAEEVANTIRRDPVACRQLAARARTHVREARPHFQVEKQRGVELADAFFTASRSGDMKALGAMLAADVSVHADGGGKRPAAMQPIFGFDAVMKIHEQLAAYFRKNGSKLVRAEYINGLPGFVTLEADGELQTTALEIEDEKVVAIYVVRNPDNLSLLPKDRMDNLLKAHTWLKQNG
jgi:RNA polymerase sigma-70 factor, ECF subfamily